MLERIPHGRCRSSNLPLALISDERLTEEMRRGSAAAFNVFYRRYHARTLGLCRSILGSRDDAEEATQHAFAAVWGHLQRPDRAAPDDLRSWLFTVARHGCLSMLRSRPPAWVELPDVPMTETLTENVAQRASVRALMSDLDDLPPDQRAALVLSELEGLSHAEIATLLGRPASGIKTLVFEARKTLTDWREARETPCADIRAALAVLRGGSLRRRALRRHLQHCASCSAFREQVRRQRLVDAGPPTRRFARTSPSASEDVEQRASVSDGRS